MRLSILLALPLAACASTGTPEFGSPESIFSPRPLAIVNDCVAKSMLDNYGKVNAITAGGRSVYIVANDQITMYRAEAQAEGAGTRITFHSFGLGHVRLKKEMEACV